MTWADVPVDPNGTMTCPMKTCDEELTLTASYAVPMVAEEQPRLLLASEAVADHWQVECMAGHVLYTSQDGIRDHNATLDSPDDEGWLYDDSESAPPYDHRAAHERIHTLWEASR